MIHTIEFDIPTLREIRSEWVKFYYSIYKKTYSIEDYLFSHLPILFWILMFKITHRCGPRSTSHTPIHGNRKRWLWKLTRSKGKYISTCAVCGYKSTQSDAIIPRYYAFAKRGREEDLKQLHGMYKTATNEAERTAIKHSISKINNEDSRVTAMRESLVKATRDNNHPEIKDIHDYTSNKRALRHE